MKLRPRDVAILIASLSLDCLAFGESAGAGLIALSVSLSLVGHYASLALLAGGLGKSGLRLAFLASVLTLMAFFALLLLVGLKAPRLFPWAAASGCVPPFVLSLSAGIEGLLSMKRRAA